MLTSSGLFQKLNFTVQSKGEKSYPAVYTELETSVKVKVEASFVVSLFCNVFLQ